MAAKNESLYRIENKHFERSLFKGLAAILILTGSIVFIYFLAAVLNNYSLPLKGESPDLENSSKIGDFIGGVVGTIFSLAGVILLIWTLREQRESFHRERLESIFFEMVKFHRENVSEIRYSYYDPTISTDKSHRVTAEKRKVFRLIFSDFKAAYEELEALFASSSENDIYVSGYIDLLNSNQTIQERQIDLLQYARIDITYLIIFFGVGEEGRETILKITKNRYNKNFIELAVDLAALKPKKESKNWEVWQRNNYSFFPFETSIAILEKRRDSKYESGFLNGITYSGDPVIYHNPFYTDDYNKYYGGHQFRLGHYFRHFFQTVNYIDGEKSLNYLDKYKYLKILRGQMSTYEQIIFFLNSLSTIGRVWEFEKRYKANEAYKKNRHLITKYNLIKNIPNDEIIAEIKLTTYYPHITYEAFDNSIAKKERKKLVEEVYH